MQDALLLSRADLERVLDSASVITALEEAFRAEHRGEWDTPKRIAAHTKAGALLAMPCGGGSPPALGAKLASVFSGNGALGLPSVSGLYALFDPATGVPQAVMDGGYLTLVRTAAVSALATRLLSRPDATTLGVLGAGAQAEFHVRLIATVRPIERVVVWARRKPQAEAMVASLRALEDLRRITSWRVVDDPMESAAADVVVTATSVKEPILFGRWLRPGSHLNAIGAHTRTTREIDAEAVLRASILAIETTDTLLEAGDLQMAEAEAGGVVERVLTLGALLETATASPREDSAITMFKSCGVAFEDLALAALAVRRAHQMRLGATFDFSRAAGASSALA